MKILYLFIFLSFVACKEKNDERENARSFDKNVDITRKTVDIPIDANQTGSARFSELFSSISYTMLTSPPGNLVGKVDKLIEANNKLFLKSNGKIFIFDKNGNFLSKIDQKGEGPGQYRSLTDFVVDTTAHRVEILDNHGFSISVFTYSGTFVETWTHGILAFQFQKLDADRYLFYSDKELAATYVGRFLLYDRSRKKVIDSYLPIDKKRIGYEGFLDVNNFYTYKNQTLLSCSGNDTIFSFKSGKVEPKYVFNFSNKSVVDKVYSQQYESVVDFNNARLKNELAGLYYNAFAETDRMLIAQVVKAKEVYFLWLDKFRGKARLIDRFDDDLSFQGSRVDVNSLFPTYFGSRKAFRVLEPEAIMEPLDSLQQAMSDDDWISLLKKNPDLNRLRKRVKLDSNPVVQTMVYK